MKRQKFLPVFLLAALFLPFTAFGGVLEQYCFLNNFGQTYRLTGGKLGKKAYVVEANVPGCGILTGIATAAKLTGGGYALDMQVTRDSAAVCTTADFSFLTPENFLTGTGVFDNLPRGFSTDGNITISQIACASFLTGTTGAKPSGPAPNIPQE